jgi:hydroxymethylpyrimidine pyrophosphatase-like HAD family hydrolase
MSGFSMTPIRIVYTDLDGTMVGPWGCFFRTAAAEPDLAAARALVDLLAAEVTLVLVSGRTRPQLAEAARIFGADGYVGELGAVVGWHHATRHEVLRGRMPEKYTGTLVEVLHTEGLVAALLERYEGRLDYHAPWHLDHESDVMLRGTVDPAEVETWLRGQGFGWVRLHDNGRLPTYDTAGAERHVYHLMADGLSKGGGVAADLARRGLRPDQAIAIGDSFSDLSMAPHVHRFFLTANGLRSPAAAAAVAATPNATVCRAEVGLGWAEAVRYALEFGNGGETREVEEITSNPLRDPGPAL